MKKLVVLLLLAVAPLGAQPAADRPGVGGVGDAIETVLGQRLFRFIGPRGQQVKVPIELHGIGIEDHPAGLHRHAQGQGGLAAGGRSRDQADGRHRFTGLRWARVARI